CALSRLAGGSVALAGDGVSGRRVRAADRPPAVDLDHRHAPRAYLPAGADRAGVRGDRRTAPDRPGATTGAAQAVACRVASAFRTRRYFPEDRSMRPASTM